MEDKIKWNWLCYRSLHKAFSDLVDKHPRGHKADCQSAAVAMFILASPEDRQKWIERIRVAHARSGTQTVLEAIKEQIESEELAQKGNSPGRRSA